jgi:hypothetical protein
MPYDAYAIASYCNHVFITVTEAGLRCSAKILKTELVQAVVKHLTGILEI